MPNLKISQLTGATTPLTGAEVLPVVQSGATKQVSVANLTAGRSVATGNLTTTGTTAFTVNTANTAGMTGTNSSNGAYFTLSVGGATGFGIANWANSTVLESVPVSTGGLVVGTFSGNVNFQVARFTYASLSNTALTFTAINLKQGTAAKGIDFTANTPAAGMTSQLLNWYEEGTWTPTLGGNTTYSAQAGTYTRIGRQVTVHFVIGVTTLGTGSGSDIGGLPFKVISTNRGGGGVAFVNAPATAFASINPYAVANDTFIRFVCGSTAGAWTDIAVVFANGTTISGTVTYFV